MKFKRQVIMLQYNNYSDLSFDDVKPRFNFFIFYLYTSLYKKINCKSQDPQGFKALCSELPYLTPLIKKGIKLKDRTERVSKARLMKPF